MSAALLPGPAPVATRRGSLQSVTFSMPIDTDHHAQNLPPL